MISKSSNLLCTTAFISFLLYRVHGDDYRYRKSGNLRGILPKAEVGNTTEDAFVPLSCNLALGGAKCEPWTSVFGHKVLYNAKVIVPCGECIIMDLPGPKLRLEKGIDVQGKLLFPDGYKLHVETSSIIVQGELSMTSTSIVSQAPKIRVTMIANETSMIKPFGNNQKACPLGGCDVGQRSISVAGGRVSCKCLSRSILVQV